MSNDYQFYYKIMCVYLLHMHLNNNRTSSMTGCPCGVSVWTFNEREGEHIG